jgi:hypothetical protein
VTSGPIRVRTPALCITRIHALPGWRLSSEYRRRVVLLGSDRVQPIVGDDKTC